VYGEIINFGGDYRAAMSLINNFAKQIAEDNAVAEVNLLKLPLDIRSESGLNGSTATVAGKDKAGFEIVIIFRNGA